MENGLFYIDILSGIFLRIFVLLREGIFFNV